MSMNNWIKPISMNELLTEDLFTGAESRNYGEILKEKALQALNTVFEILHKIVTEQIQALKNIGVNEKIQAWLNKISLCAYALIIAIASIPRTIGGKVKTVKTEMREFDKGIAEIIKGMKRSRIPTSEAAQFEAKRQSTEKELTYIECYPTHGKYGRERMAIKRIIVVIRYHLGIDITQYKIQTIDRLYQQISDLADLEPCPDSQFFRKYAGSGSREENKKLIEAIDELKAKQKTAVADTTAADISNKKAA